MRRLKTTGSQLTKMFLTTQVKKKLTEEALDYSGLEGAENLDDDRALSSANSEELEYKRRKFSPFHLLVSETNFCPCVRLTTSEHILLLSALLDVSILSSQHCSQSDHKKVWEVLGGDKESQ